MVSAAISTSAMTRTRPDRCSGKSSALLTIPVYYTLSFAVSVGVQRSRPVPETVSTSLTGKPASSSNTRRVTAAV